MAKLVYSYAHADEAFRIELEKHLSPLKRLGLIEAWHDRMIVAGEHFAGEIDRHFAEADIVLLLVSPDFVNSDYCFDIEMKGALERHERDRAVVIPVILRPCHWTNLPFGKLQASTKDGKPIVHYASHDDGFYEVVASISRSIASLKKRANLGQTHAPSTTSFAPEPATPSAAVTQNAPSNIVRLKRSFTDLDRDRALKECFEHVASFFQTSLDEVKNGHPNISFDFTRVDAKGFEVTIYADGTRRSKCGIWYGGDRWSGDLTYSSSGVTPGSFNDSVHLEDDGYALFFKALGVSFGDSQGKGRLDQHGVAEHFWRTFIRPLQ